MIDGPPVYGFGQKFKSSHDIPVVVSILPEADLSFVFFIAKLVGEEVNKINITYHPEPMTLYRF